MKYGIFATAVSLVDGGKKSDLESLDIGLWCIMGKGDMDGALPTDTLRFSDCRLSRCPVV